MVDHAELSDFEICNKYNIDNTGLVCKFPFRQIGYTSYWFWDSEQTFGLMYLVHGFVQVSGHQKRFLHTFACHTQTCSGCYGLFATF